jgi:hypothetical protein
MYLTIQELSIKNFEPVSFHMYMQSTYQFVSLIYICCFYLDFSSSIKCQFILKVIHSLICIQIAM